MILAAVLHVCCLPGPGAQLPLSPGGSQEQKQETGPAVRTGPNRVRQLMHPAHPGLYSDIWYRPVMLPTWDFMELPTSFLPEFDLYTWAEAKWGFYSWRLILCWSDSSILWGHVGSLSGIKMVILKNAETCIYIVDVGQQLWPWLFKLQRIIVGWSLIVRKAFLELLSKTVLQLSPKQPK